MPVRAPHRRPLFAVLGTCALVLLVTRYCLAQAVVRFESPHVVHTPAARLDDELARAIDAEIEQGKMTSIDQLLRFSLHETGKRLHFGLEHKTTLQFAQKEREGNCVEYAHLFATLFNRAADRKHVPARAFVVRSDARLLGRKSAAPAFADHDWVLVVPLTRDGQRRFVDPTFHDLGLDWDISRSVSGEVRPPIER